jgi:histidine triad (HIT) family protein
MSSIFSKIVSGEIPAHKVYEDDLTLAFLDIHPKTEGHTLVIPKVEIDEFQDLSEEDYQAVMKTVQKVSKRLKEIYPGKRVGIQVIGVDVPHAHIHVFPFADLEEFRAKQDMTAEPDHDQLASVAKKLAF